MGAERQNAYEKGFRKPDVKRFHRARITELLKSKQMSKIWGMTLFSS